MNLFKRKLIIIITKMSGGYSTQNNLLLNKLNDFYADFTRLDRMLAIINVNLKFLSVLLTGL